MVEREAMVVGSTVQVEVLHQLDVLEIMVCTIKIKKNQITMKSKATKVDNPPNNSSRSMKKQIAVQ